MGKKQKSSNSSSHPLSGNATLSDAPTIYEGDSSSLMKASASPRSVLDSTKHFSTPSRHQGHTASKYNSVATNNKYLHNCSLPPATASSTLSSVMTPSASRPRFRRRPDRHPFVVDVPGSLFFATRAMPQPNTRYSVVVGESFWRLATYIDSVPSRREERIPGRSPHVLITGPGGCGKSFLMAATSALLGFGPASLRPDEYGKYLSADYRCVFLGDCRKWCESEDPLTYFRMELLRGLRDVTAPHDTDDHHATEHLGCLLCVEPFTRVDQVKAFLDKCCRWVEEYQPDTLLVFFLDQAEELIGRKPASCIPLQIIQILLAAELPLLVWSVRNPAEVNFPWRTSCGLVLNIPYRANWEEFTKHLELHVHSLAASAAPAALEGSKLINNWGRDMVAVREIRFWTGGVPAEITEFFNMTFSSTASGNAFIRLSAYRRNVIDRISSSFLSHVTKLDGKQKNVLLIVLFAIVLRVPMDMSGEFNIGNILALGPAITGYLLLHTRQSFFHSTDGIITLADVPAALTPTLHLALVSSNTLSAILRNWSTLFENVVQAMILSKLLCPEAKRRMTRFYAHAKFLWSLPGLASEKEGWNLIGAVSETGETLRIKFSRPRSVIFAGQTPPPHFFTDPQEHHCTSRNHEAYDAVILLPGRTGYWFFDFFVYIPGERRLFAVTTSATVGMWLKDLMSTPSTARLRAGANSSGSNNNNPTGIHTDTTESGGIIQPAALLDQWREALRKAGLPKVQVRCAIMRTADLLLAMGFNVTGATFSVGDDVNQSTIAPVETQITHLAKLLGEACF